MTAIPPSLSSWSKQPENRCAPDEIPAYWERHDVITFLADIGMYAEARYHSLDAAEKEQHRQFKSEYFKKRFTVSRSLLRQILNYIPGAEKNADIVMGREKNGRIGITGRPDIFISVSYSGSCIALTVGKRKIGSDIEIVHQRESRKIRNNPLFDSLANGNGKGQDHNFVHAWTLLEAYAKFHDMSLYPLTPDRFFFPDTHFVSYCIDRHAVFSLAYGGTPLQDALLWIDPGCGLASGSGENPTNGSSPLLKGDSYVRT